VPRSRLDAVLLLISVPCAASDKTLGCYRECAGKKVVRCVRVAPCALPIAWLERSAWLWRLDASQRVLRWGATGVLGGLRVGESLRAPQGTRHQPAGRGAPLPRAPPLANSKRTSPCTGNAAHVALSLRDHRGRHRRAPPRRERRESGADRGRGVCSPRSCCGVSYSITLSRLQLTGGTGTKEAAPGDCPPSRQPSASNSRWAGGA
jgi:hypothetical protein